MVKPLPEVSASAGRSSAKASPPPADDPAAKQALIDQITADLAESVALNSQLAEMDDPAHPDPEAEAAALEAAQAATEAANALKETIERTNHELAIKRAQLSVALHGGR